LRLLLSIYRQITGAGGKIALAAVVDEIKDTMSVTGFLKFFVVHDTVAEAVASLSA
jgi:anti-sigma B factor antagonist